MSDLDPSELLKAMKQPQKTPAWIKYRYLAGIVTLVIILLMILIPLLLLKN